MAYSAKRIAEEAREISREAVRQARRQAILASVPHLIADRPDPRGNPPERFRISVRTGGPTVAYGILASLAGARERRLDAIDEPSRSWSDRQVALPFGPHPLTLTIPNGQSAAFPWLHVRLEYVSPLGAQVRHDYLGPSDIRNKRYRLHQVTIDARDGAEPLRFDIALGPFDEEAEPETLHSPTTLPSSATFTR